MKFLFITLCFLSSSLALGFDHSHNLWDKVLGQYVVEKEKATLLRYDVLQKNRADFDLYLNVVQSVKKADYESWTPDQKLAYLFNSYNALTVELILKNSTPQKPLKSIKDIGNLFRSSWKIKFFNFLEEKSHLDRIEQEIARPNFDEPRLHFAFNCASLGCPNLLKEAFVAEKLNQQLDQATRSFLADESRNRLSKDGKILEISQIFNWYADDFENSKKFKSLREFLITHIDLSPNNMIKVRSGDIQLKYLDYNWNLNSLR